MIPITLTTQLGDPPVEIMVEKGITLEALAKKYQGQMPFRVLAAKVNNVVRELTKEILEPAAIVFLDMRTIAAKRIYQDSVSFIFLKAIDDIYGGVKVNIENALSKGLYTEIKTKKHLTDEEIKVIEDRMHQLVDDDIPFVKKILSREEALSLFSGGNHEEKRRMLNRATDVSELPVYSLEGYLNFFYGQMAPSTGYIQHFELRKYRNGVLLRFPDAGSPDRTPDYIDDAQLYRAFGEAKKWGKLMGISYVEDLNQKISTGEYKEIIQISEALHEKKIAQIADEIIRGGKRIILISGPSSSGKTTFAKRLNIQLRVGGEQPLYIGTDDYFVERYQTPILPDGSPNFEDIEAIDLKLFNENINDLLAGKKVDLPTFDFYQGKKIYGRRITKIHKHQPIIIEGIHSLNRMLTSGIKEEEKYKIYISPFTQLNIDNHNRIPTTDARLLRRIVRDNQFRGYTADKTIEQWIKVRAGEDKNIFPFNGEAHMLFNSAHIYEISVLKKYAEPLLESIKPEEVAYGEAVRLLKFLRFFNIIEDDSVIANNSIIREFIGGSIIA